MTQADLGTLDPQTTDGPELANLLTNWRDALHSAHKGATRPAYAVAGTLWIDDAASPWLLKAFDGAEDVLLGQIDPVANTFTITLPDGSITNAKLADMTSKRFKARTAVGTGDAEDLTAEAALSMMDQLTELTSVDGLADFVLGLDATDGLAKKIKPANLGGVVPIASFTVGAPVAEVVFNSIPAEFTALLITYSGVSGSAANGNLQMQVSTDNGATFLATGYSGVLGDTTAGLLTTLTTVFELGITVAAAGTLTGAGLLVAHAGPQARKLLLATNAETHSAQTVAAAAIDALRFFWDSGNIDAGTFELHGLR